MEFVNLPSRPTGRILKMFFPVSCCSRRRHNRPLTSSQLGSKHMSNTIMLVNCRIPVDRPNSPTVWGNWRQKNEPKKKHYTSKSQQSSSIGCVGCGPQTIFTLTKWIIPAAVNQTEMKIDTNWAKRMELDVFNTFKYCKISGTVIRRSALRKRRPAMQTIFY